MDASNYPFCTIDPNVGVVAVPDERLEKLGQLSKSEKVTPTVVEFVDIAGLVKNAHAGEGLGNQFLSHIREVDAIVEVLRDFEDKNVTHVEGSLDPERDKEIIALELVMADLQAVEKRLDKVTKDAKSGEKEVLKVAKVLELLKVNLADGKLASEAGLNDEERLLIKDLSLLTLKPIMFVKNTNNLQLTTNNSQLNDFIEIDAKKEAELADLSDEELEELGVRRTGLDKLICKSYEILNLITFFTSGPKETRAWTVVRGAKAPVAAGRIHTDFEKGFIRAEVIKYEDYITAGGEYKAKEKGLMRVEGKEYEVKDGDVIYFRISS